MKLTSQHRKNKLFTGNFPQVYLVLIIYGQTVHISCKAT